MEPILEGQKREFTVPSGYKYTIREQNGADDDILSNQVDAMELKNLSRFIAAIVVDTDYTANRKLTLEQAHNLPALDKYCILFNSRIFSLGDTVEFEYDWGEQGGRVSYEQDVNEFLFDYAEDPTEEELEAKPFAIPYYPLGKQLKDIEFTTSSGKQVKFDLLTTKGEAYILNLPKEEQTKNKELIARNLHMLVNNKWEKVKSFHLFSVKDMKEIRTKVLESDPIFNGITELTNPHNPDMKTIINIAGIKDFFYPGEI